MEWDPENGIWKGSKAMSVDALPEPLYIFGYGSLMWRPGDILGKFDSFACSCKGWVRLFAQRSMDHRGTAAFPGFVATLVDSAHLPSVGFEVPFAPSDEFIGILFRIPTKDVHHVIEELDYREKGGYYRHLIEVTVLQDTPDYAANTSFSALVYTGPLSNPNFCLLDHTVSGGSIVAGDGVAEVVGAAWGPSGANAVYLIHLAKYIRSKGLHDKYLFSLLDSVAMRMASMRVYQIMSEEYDRLTPLPFANAATERADDEGKEERRTSDCLKLVGWGCNEAAQISPQLERRLIGAATHLPHVCSAVSNAVTTSAVPLLPQVYAGGSHSALLIGGSAYIWGDSKDTVVHVHNIVGCAIGHSHALLLHSSGKVCSFGDNSHSQCKLDSSVPEQDHVSYFTDIAAIAQWTCSVGSSPSSLRRVMCLAAGLRHSAMVLESGELITWGDSSYCQRLTEPWLPSDGGGIVHVACGAKHSVCVDSSGRIWTFGDNKYSQLGRPIDGKRSMMPGLAEVNDSIKGIFWSRVVCGWSHNVARGLTRDGEVVFGCWGRSDMGQLPSEIGVAVRQVMRLASIPNYPIIREVWCGSEHTVAACEDGSLWACGWGEHLNLGDGTEKQHNSRTWVPVVYGDRCNRTRVSLSSVWPEVVAAGGAYCVAITQSQT